MDSQVLIPEEWKYLAEGNQHIILAYIGNNVYLRDKILRISKQTCLLKPQPNLEKIHLVLRCFEDKQLQPYLSISRRVQTTKQEYLIFLEAIGKQIQVNRPLIRLDKDIEASEGIQISDNLFFDYQQILHPYIREELLTSFQVEIKPKSVLPVLDQQYVYEQPLSYEKSKFFKVQLQKIAKELGASFQTMTKDQILEQISKYNPLNLFQSQFELGIKGLIDTPQNNLKIFQHGQQINNINLPNFSQQLPLDLPRILVQIIKTEDIMTKINKLQTQHSDRIENILKDLESLIEDKTIEDQTIQEAFLNLSEQSENQSVNRIRKICNFMLLLSWADVSIIFNVLCFKKEVQEEFLETFKRIQIDNNWIYYKLSIIDYDIKDWQKLYEYKKQADKLNELYQLYLQKN